jgi:casein kinase II subunit beta
MSNPDDDSSSFETFCEDSTSENDQSWVDMICGMKGNSFLTHVSREFIRDSFNLTDLNLQFVKFEKALYEILDWDDEDDEDEEENTYPSRDAVKLYTLIHARFITSLPGLKVMVWYLCFLLL